MKNDIKVERMENGIFMATCHKYPSLTDFGYTEEDAYNLMVESIDMVEEYFDGNKSS